MPFPARLHRYSFAQYLAVEETSAVKHEYLDGEIYAMAGGSPRHASLAAAMVGALLEAVRGGPRQVFTSDLRIRVSATGLATYPDVSVVSGPLQTDPDSPVTVTNPSVLVEVLSDSTIDYDLGEKFEHYKQIATLKAVVYVSQHERRIEVRLRDRAGTWATRSAGPGEAAEVEALECRLSVDEIYGRAALPS